VTRRRGRRRKQLLDDLGDRRGYSHLKEESLDRIKWRNHFGRGCGPVVCLTDYWWMNEWKCYLEGHHVMNRAGYMPKFWRNILALHFGLTGNTGVWGTTIHTSIWPFLLPFNLKLWRQSKQILPNVSTFCRRKWCNVPEDTNIRSELCETEISVDFCIFVAYDLLDSRIYLLPFRYALTKDRSRYCGLLRGRHVGKIKL
jgi:hypothetical protein